VADAGRAHSEVFIPRQQSWFGQQLSTAENDVSGPAGAIDIIPWQCSMGLAICRLQCSPIGSGERASATVPKAGMSITSSRNLAVQRYMIFV